MQERRARRLAAPTHHQRREAWKKCPVAALRAMPGKLGDQWKEGVSVVAARPSVSVFRCEKRKISLRREKVKWAGRGRPALPI